MRRLMLKALLTRWLVMICLVYVGLVLKEDSTAHMTMFTAAILVWLLVTPFAIVTKREKVLVELLPPEELRHAQSFALHILGVAFGILILTWMAILSAHYWDPLLSTAKEGEWARMYQLFVFYWVVPVLALLASTTACARIGQHGLSVKLRADQA